jgi:dTMP kinase
MTTGRGTFIAIEGTDGSGKDTQSKQLAARLADAGHDVVVFDFPQYDQPSSFFVSQYLNGRYGGVEDVGPYTASLFYALDRYQAAPKIREALAQGKIVIANRFVGSNMAHQGTKFQHAEERRGFFIWLDNLEFEMLRVPRPALSLVLRVPAETAQILVGGKQQRSYTDKTHDIHEADLSHLQRAVAVYDDMCQLFPNDFVRIDCTRNGQMLDIVTINNLMWHKVAPLLPGGRSDKGSVTTASTSPAPRAETGAAQPLAQSAPPAAIPDELAARHFFIAQASSLLAGKIEQGRSAAYLSKATEAVPFEQKEAGKYRYYTPDYLEPRLREQYTAYMDQLFNLYGELLAGLTKHLQNAVTRPAHTPKNTWDDLCKRRARGVIRPVLPLAAQEPMDIYASGEAIERLIMRLMSDQLPEARKAGEGTLARVREIAPAFMERVATPERGGAALTYRATTDKKVNRLAKELLPVNHTNPTKSVQLTDVWPRNELDVVPEMLYGYSSLPLDELRKAAQDWSFATKTSVIETYIGDRTHSHYPGRALEKTQYGWDILCDFDALRRLQQLRGTNAVETQILTPRYGYDMPKVIEKADLTDLYEACFDLSLRLHSLLQEAGYTHEAQYATLFGHKQRAKLTYNAREAFRLFASKPAPGEPASYRQIIIAMHEKIQEIHPLLGELMSSSTPDVT